MSKILVGIVGKPSSGKSTYLNCMCNTKSKMGNYPFTTLEAQVGVCYDRFECVCKNQKLKDMNVKCSPKYDRCENGIRFSPIKMYDIPGLIPDAHLGKGLGNQFLDSVRKADLLMHIVDSSGQTNAKGQNCETHYDVWKDVLWIEDEIVEWIHGNLWKRWERITKLHRLHHVDVEELFQKYLGGYGCKRSFTNECFDKIQCFSKAFYMRNLFGAKNQERKVAGENNEEEILIKERYTILDWKESHLKDFVRQFVKIRFPILLVLNKVDLKGASKNMLKIYEKFSNYETQPTSTLSELFLQKLEKKGIISYKQGDSDFKILDEEKLEKLKLQKKLQKIKENVLDRFDCTGCNEAIKKAIEMIDPVTIFPIFVDKENGKKILKDTLIIKKGTTCAQVYKAIMKDGDVKYSIENLKGTKVGNGYVFTGENADNIIIFKHDKQTE